MHARVTSGVGAAMFGAHLGERLRRGRLAFLTGNVSVFGRNHCVAEDGSGRFGFEFMHRLRGISRGLVVRGRAGGLPERSEWSCRSIDHDYRLSLGVVTGDDSTKLGCHQKSSLWSPECGISSRGEGRTGWCCEVLARHPVEPRDVIVKNPPG